MWDSCGNLSVLRYEAECDLLITMQIQPVQPKLSVRTPDHIYFNNMTSRQIDWSWDFKSDHKAMSVLIFSSMISKNKNHCQFGTELFPLWKLNLKIRSLVYTPLGCLCACVCVCAKHVRVKMLGQRLFFFLRTVLRYTGISLSQRDRGVVAPFPGPTTMRLVWKILMITQHNTILRRYDIEYQLLTTLTDEFKSLSTMTTDEDRKTDLT